MGWMPTCAAATKPLTERYWSLPGAGFLLPPILPRAAAAGGAKRMAEIRRIGIAKPIGDLGDGMLNEIPLNLLKLPTAKVGVKFCAGSSMLFRRKTQESQLTFFTAGGTQRPSSTCAFGA